jgi:short-subunit dehydrogenase
VLLVGRDQVALHRVGKRIGGRTCVVDLARGQAVDELLAALDGTPDLLVCNAGIGWAGELGDISPSEVDNLVQVNLLSHLRLARELVPAMARRGRGHLVLVSSIAGCLGVRDEAVYAATKGALRVFGESVRLEVAGCGVGVSVVVPGVVDTPFFARRGKPYDRRWPRPIPAEAVARALVDAVERGRAEVFVPRWLLVPARLHGLAPGLVRTLHRRFA